MAAALKVFAEKGFSEATNRDIAREAGIRSPGLIYHYFPSKMDLLRAIADRFSPITNFTQSGQTLFSFPPEVVLTKIGEMYLTLYRNAEVQSVMKVILGESLRNSEFAETFAKVGPLRILSFLSKYLEHLMDRGELRRIDPSTAARGFLGPFVTLFIFRTVFGQHEEFTVDEPSVVADTVKLFLEGLRVRQG